MRIKDLDINERPRERLLKFGQEALSNAELIAIILRIGTKNENVMTMASKLLKEYPLQDLASKRVSQLMKIKGIGTVKACQIAACMELAKRTLISSDSNIYLKTAEDAIKLLKPEMENLDKEHFVILILDTRNKLIKKEKIFIGTLNNSIIHPREIFKPAIIESAAAIILIHNHPSGDPSPSTDDIAITKRLKESGKTLGIDIIDHIIIGKKKCYSFLDNEIL